MNKVKVSTKHKGSCQLCQELFSRAKMQQLSSLLCLIKGSLHFYGCSHMTTKVKVRNANIQEERDS